ncbi:ferritin heavy chain [Procambarus clarkii]|nr:ferritin subunit-like [Procambarus clarkii]
MALRAQVWLLVLGFAAAQTTNEAFQCERNIGFPKAVCFTQKCADAINGHIKHELDAAFKYMYMGAKFAQFTEDRPGIAHFLMEAAAEERGHAIQMMDYLNMRGIKLTPSFTYVFPFDSQLTQEIQNMTYRSALEEAINMEIQVTNLIYNVVSECVQDYHAADLFTSSILGEQHEGVRKLQGALKAYDDLSLNYIGEGAELAEYIFDRKIMSEKL